MLRRSSHDAHGREIDRDDLEALAERHGLVPQRSVIAKACQLLIAADTSTRYGTSDAAKKFGIPIAALEDFIAALHTGQPLDVVRFDQTGVALVVVECGLLK